ncbi:mechanosensitive ion channel protein [Massilia sp. Root351]|jgi:small-conductance mechanosensitive channel|uniref:mechanosensitive ion channel family protein n=1 Tax=Massilia sp. Root351 TaxID=1736522 RepID=UPI00070A4819|nr:mechanosensitive ion channel domain-containing protein [Massilia sp. Root351]KQV80151.1 mechanosensitive ion channel protein [Massilia sp. Root351]
MKQEPLKNLITDLLTDLRDPGLMWQLGALVLAIVLGYVLSGLLRKRVTAHEPATGMARFGMESFSRVIGPLAIACLIFIAQVVLVRYQKVHLLKVALPIFGSLAAIRFVFFLLRRVFARRGGEIGATMLTFEKIFQLLVWACVAMYITGWWDDVFFYLDHTVLPLGKNKVSVADILQAAISVVVLLMLALWAGAALEERLMGLQTVHSSLRVVLARFGRALLIVVAVLGSLSMVGIDLTVLSVFGGALGVGLGLGLQKIASNYVSGFIILLDRSLTIGDMITVDKYTGRVTQINTRYTVLQGLDGVESIVPNEMLVSGAVQNSSLSNKNLWLSTKVSVAYDTDVDQALGLLEQAALSIERVVKDKPPSATLVNFGADGLDLQVGWWIADPENGRGGVTSDVNRAIWKALQEHKISVPFPQREMRIIGPVPLPEDTETPKK